MRPRTDVHDLEVKIRSIVRFLESGDKVKVTIRFRSREMAYTDQGHALLVKVAERVKEYGVIEQHAKREGRQLFDFIFGMIFFCSFKFGSAENSQ